MSHLNLLDKNNNFNILLAGIIGLFIGVGVARFAYTSLLPSMLADQTLSLTFSGVLASTNYIGYLLGALFAVFIKDIHAKVKYFRLGLVLCIVTTIMMGIATHDLWLIVSRVMAGFGAAMTLVVGAAIVMVKLNFKDKTKAMGIYFSGIAIALAMADIIARLVLISNSWQISWLVLSLSAALVSPYAWYILSTQQQPQSKNTTHTFDKKIFSNFVIILIVAYFTAGVGMVVQGTFLPTIIQSLPGLESFAGFTWLLVGLAGIPSSIIWMRLAHRYGSVNIIIIAMSIQIIGILIPTISHNLYLNLLSGILYGGTFVGLVALFMHLGGKLAGNNPVILMGALTTAYGIGQVSAPLYAAILTSQSGNYNHALYVTAAIVFSGVFMLLASKIFNISHQPY
ncbi:MAG: YbfB/YjiJ family MFS transporter [Proteobacteria bacterium]|nr:YbfB/YjiJ family MFS transporter [Pseudomonadota bacterium]MCH9711610.1 YbfB/YjiJ family MFS transporter [Pseudomonadota bacterium]MCH9750178.1 YbfB/YjiJ family MFS transporter [Pseudomonadota bacterium]